VQATATATTSFSVAIEVLKRLLGQPGATSNARSHGALSRLHNTTGGHACLQLYGCQHAGLASCTAFGGAGWRVWCFAQQKRRMNVTSVVQPTSACSRRGSCTRRSGMGGARVQPCTLPQGVQASLTVSPDHNSQSGWCPASHLRLGATAHRLPACLPVCAGPSPEPLARPLRTSLPGCLVGWLYLILLEALSRHPLAPSAAVSLLIAHAGQHSSSKAINLPGGAAVTLRCVDHPLSSLNMASGCPAACQSLEARQQAVSCGGSRAGVPVPQHAAAERPF
jgi:hypothetical protein